MPDRELPPPNWPLYFAASAIWLAVGLWVTLTQPQQTARGFVNLGYVLLPLAGAVATYRRAMRQRERRTGWMLFTAAFLSWSLAGVYWSFHEHWLGRSPPFPGLSDIGFLAHVLLAAAALYLLLPQWAPRPRPHELLDMLFVGIVFAYGVYDLVLKPTLDLSQRPLATLTALAYPAVDILVLTLCIFMLSRGRPGRRLQPALIGGGLALRATIDVIWIYQTNAGTYQSGQPFDLLWHISFMAVICGIVYRQVDLSPVDELGAGASRHAVPLALAVVLAGLLVVDAATDGIDAFEGILLMVLVLVAAGRQTIALLHIDRLRAKVQEEARKLEVANQRLVEAAASKIQFIHATGHELSNPLTPLRMQAKLLADPVHAGSAERRERSVVLITRAVDRLRLLVDDLLNLARVEGGSIRIAHQRFDLVPLLKEVASLYQGPASDRQVRIEVAAAGEAPMLGDPERVGQIVANFLTNAIKYAPEGSTVQVHLDARPAALTVKVVDQGPGLSEEQRGRLFQPFSQVQGQDVQRHGTGLGLYISKTLAERLGGQVGCDSDGLGKGATFWLQLPREPSPPIPPP